MDLALSPRMAKVFGAAGKHAGRQSVAAFKKMFSTVLIVAVVAAFCEGAVVTTFFTTHIRIGWIGLPIVIGILLLWLLNYANRRVDQHETDRLNWRKGALGEYEVGAELERLSDEFFIFNDLNTAGFGNFDHVVVGPTGLFAIETKNWSGLVDADGIGELKENGKNSSSPHVRRFVRRTMMLRDQVIALTHSNNIYIRSVMVFPKARVAARFGDTGNVHCLQLGRLRDYIDNPKFSQQLRPDRVNELVRALNGIAGMDEQFGSRHSAGD